MNIRYGVYIHTHVQVISQTLTTSAHYFLLVEAKAQAALPVAKPAPTKQELGEELYKLVKSKEPELCGKITGRISVDVFSHVIR